MSNQRTAHDEMAGVDARSKDIADLRSDVQDLLSQKENSLQPLEPQEGIERYLRGMSSEIAESTIDGYRGKLQYFSEYCEKEEIHNLNELTGRTLDAYRTWRREKSTRQPDSLNTKTMRDDMYLIRDFLRYLEKIEAVEAYLGEKVKIPELENGDGIRHIELESERTTRVLDHLFQYRYASREHVVWLLHCHTGRRPGGIHSLDLYDVFTDVCEPYVKFRHDGETTRLKNGINGEGQINISEKVAEVLDDYIDQRRIDAEDSEGREPLLTSRHGRLSKSTMRKYFYKWTRPCEITDECPHNRNISECDSAQSIDQASKCPSSQPPYASRHGYLTQKRREGVPKALLSDRCDVSEEILEKHYDERTEEERREARREFFDQVTDKGGYGL